MNEGEFGFRVWGLGPFIIETREGCIREGEWRSGYALKLLKYLLVNFDQVVPSEKLVDIFWSDYDLEGGKKRLYDTVYKLRNILDCNKSSLEESYIVKNHLGYMLNPNKNYWFDWQEFSQLYWWLRSVSHPLENSDEYIAALERGVSLYRDEFFPGDKYEDWTEIYREQYREMFLNILLLAGKFYIRYDDLETGYKFIQKGIQQEPYREDFYLFALKILKSQNRIWDAVKLYKKYEQILKKDLNIEPSDDIKNLYNNLHNKNSFYTSEETSGVDYLKQKNGALLCSKTVFKNIYEMEQRRAQRSPISSLVLLINFNEERSLININQLASDISLSLRRADIVATLSGQKIIILFYNTAPSYKDKIFIRLGKVLDEFKFTNVSFKWKTLDGTSQNEDNFIFG